MRIDVMPASILEMEEIVCKENKLSGKPVFFKKNMGADALIVRVFAEDGSVLRTSLLRISQGGELRLCDRSNRLGGNKIAQEVEDDASNG